MQRAALYARVSNTDDHDDRTDRQLVRLRKLAADSGYEVVAEFEDDGKSAFRGKHRPEWQKMLLGLKAGKFNVIVAVSVDRLSRSKLEGEMLQATLAQRGGIVHAINGGIFNPSDGLSGVMLSLLTAVAELESIEKSNRTRAARANTMAQGIPNPTRRRFGYEKDGITIRESEAELIRAAYDAILERGESLRSIAVSWEKAGVQRTREASAPWQATHVKRILTNPRVAGILIREGERMPKSQIQPIVTEEQLQTLTERLDINGKRGPGEKSLLSGLLYCTCGHVLTKGVRNTRRKDSIRPWIYRCTPHNRPTHLKGPHVTVDYDVANEEAVELLWHVLLDRTARDEKKEQPAELTKALQERSDLHKRKQHVTSLLLDPLLDGGTLRVELTKIAQRQDELEAEIARLQTEDFGLEIESAASIARVHLRAGLTWHPAYAAQMEEGETIQDVQLRRFREAFAKLDIEDQRRVIRGTMTLHLHPGRGRGRLEAKPLQA